MPHIRGKLMTTSTDMVLEFKSLTMVVFMRALGLMINAKVMATKFTRQVVSIKGNFSKTSLMAKEPTFGPMEKSSRENGINPGNKALESGKESKEIVTQVNGKIICKRAMVCMSGPMGINTRESGNTVLRMGKEQIYSLTKTTIQGSILMVFLTEKAPTSGKAVHSTKEGSSKV